MSQKGSDSRGMPISVYTQPFTNIVSVLGEFLDAQCTDWLKMQMMLPDRRTKCRRICKCSQQKVGAVLVEVCSKCEQHQCENVCELSRVLIQNLSKVLKLRIFPTGSHLDQKTANAPLQLGVRHRATVANNSRAGCLEFAGSKSCHACAVGHFRLRLPTVFWSR